MSDNKTVITGSNQYHTNHIREALGILKNIDPGQKILKQSIIKQCNEYAIDVLGHNKYAPWLYVYSAFCGEFKEGWIPDNYYGSKVIPALKGHYGRVAALTPLNRVFFQSDNFPDLGSYVNGLFLDRTYAVIKENEIKDYLFSKTDRIVFKLDGSGRGKGIFFYDKEDFNVSAVRKLGNGLFQQHIEQHLVFEEYAASTATLRITTACDDHGVITVRSCYIRFGSGHDTHVKSDSSVRIPIDIQSGYFDEHGHLTNWLTVTKHPTSNVGFQGKRIPEYDNCIQTVKNLHKKVPYVRCIGWDVTVDSSEKVNILEWNGGHNGIKYSEATQGPCFSDLGWERFKI